MMARNAGIRLTLVASALCIFGASGQAFGSAKSHDTNQWFFDGSTYKTEATAEDRPHINRKDPVNFIFYRGGEVHRGPLQTHLKDHISGWKDHGDMIRICRDDQRMFWRHLPGLSSDRSDFHNASRAHCFNRTQTHARFWDALEHRRGNPGHDANEWIVGGIHHEKIVLKKKGIAGHVPDRDWDHVRAEFVKKLSAHCSYRRWEYHAMADRVYQEIDNSGYIARISMHHRADGGCAGQ